MTIEIQKMLVLSNAHLTIETADKLEADFDWDDGRPIYYDKWQCGWFVYVPEHVDDANPADLKACLRFAWVNECDWIMFDRDGPVVEELPCYEW